MWFLKCIKYNAEQNSVALGEDINIYSKSRSDGRRSIFNADKNDLFYASSTFNDNANCQALRGYQNLRCEYSQCRVLCHQATSSLTNA